MNESLQILIVVLLVVLTVYVSTFAGRVKKLEEGNRILLQGLAPAERVRKLAEDPKNRIEAMRAFREETGADVRATVAVIDSLLSARR